MKTNQLSSILFLLFCSTFSFLNAQTFHHIHSGSSDDYGQDISATSDHGVIITGYTKSYGQGQEDIILSKKDSSGSELWLKVYGGTSYERGEAVIETEDKGFMIAGHTMSYGTGAAFSKSDATLIKTDSLGNIEWSKTYGGTNIDKAYDVKQLWDKGYIVSGLTYSYSVNPSTSDADVYVFRTDSLGNVLWSKVYGLNSTIFDIGESVAVTWDSCFAITGRIYQGSSDLFVLKLDADGNTKWNKRYDFGSGLSDWAGYIEETSDSGLVVIGSTPDIGLSDMTLMKLDSAGNVSWAKNYGGTKNDGAIEGRETADGGFILSGYSDSYTSVRKSYLVKTAADGTVEWSRLYGGATAHETYGMVETSTAYYLTGKVNNIGTTLNDVLSIKTDLNGDIDNVCNQDSSAPVVSTVTPTVTTDGSFSTGMTEDTAQFTTITPTLTVDTFICSAPTAAFAVSADTVCLGEDLVLTDQSTGNSTPDQWLWLIVGGDPDSSSSQNPTVTMNTAGSQDIQLIVSNPYGSDTVTQSVFVRTLPVLTLEDTVAIHHGDSVVLDAGAGFSTYTWNSGESTNPITYHSSGFFLEDTIYFEDFDGALTWTLDVPTGTNEGYNFWDWADTEGGSDAGTCSGLSFGNGDQTLHITAWGAGASYLTSDPFFGDPVTANTLAHTGDINTTGYSDLALSFDFFAGGEDELDYASLWYSTDAGANWDILDTVLRSDECSPGIGQWENIKYDLDASFDNQTQLRFGIHWKNNDDASGDGLSVAVNNFLLAQETPSDSGYVTRSVEVTDANGCVNTDQSVIKIIPPLTVDFSFQDSICFGDTSSITNLSSGQNLSYLWIIDGDTINSEDPVHLFSGGGDFDIKLIASDEVASDSASKSITIFPAAAPAILSSKDTICLGESVQLSVASDYASYDWSPTVGLDDTTIYNPTASPASSSDYYVSVVDTNGCTGTDSVSITVHTPPTAEAGQDSTICAATSITLSGTGGGTYSWSPTATLNDSTVANPTATPSTGTTYTLTVTDGNGCEDSDTVIISTLTAPSLSIGAVTAVCNGDSTQVTASGANTYSWSPTTGLSSSSISNPKAAPSTSTTYTLTGTGANGCSSTDSALVTIHQLPTANAGNASTICIGSEASLGGSGGSTYSWSPTDSLDDPNISNPFADPTTTTTYTLTVTDANGCQDTDEVTVTVVNGATADAGADTVICAGESVQLNASGGNAFNWSPSGSLDNKFIANPTASPSSTTNYVVVVTNSCGSASDTVIVTVNALPNVDAGADVSICDSDTATLTATGASTYTWSPSTALSCTACASTMSTTSNAITYQVNGIDANGCSASDSVSITITPATTANFTATSNVDTATFSNSSSNATSYSWDFGDGNNATDSDPVHYYDSNGVYTVTLIATGACGNDTSTQSVTITQVSVLELSQDNGLLIYPNPSSTGEITILLKGKSDEPSLIYIRNMLGELVQVLNVPVFVNDYQVQLNLNLESGNYLIYSSLNQKAHTIINITGE